MNKDVILAKWETFHYCEFCMKKDQKKTYLPLHKTVLNPMHICEDCVSEFTIIDEIDDEFLFLKKLSQLRDKR